MATKVSSGFIKDNVSGGSTRGLGGAEVLPPVFMLSPPPQFFFKKNRVSPDNYLISSNLIVLCVI